MEWRTGWDYVIVGAGAAGSVLAERLSADGDTRVLVLEQGGEDDAPVPEMPLNYSRTSVDPQSCGQLRAEASSPAGPGLSTRGQVLGGSTTVDGLLYNRGAGDWYDQLGQAPWNAASFRRAFQEIECHRLGPGTGSGDRGPLSVEVATPPDEVSDAFLATLGKLGASIEDDVNAVDSARAGYAARAAWPGHRAGAARAFLAMARQRPDVTVRPGTTVQTITFEGTLATGVTTVRDGEQIWFGADREVLVCAGALESPQLLERSGVGHPDVLDRAGVPVLIASPGVGENLRQHRGVLFVLRLREGLGHDQELSTSAGRLATLEQYLQSGSGILEHGGATVMAFLTSGQAGETADLQVLFVPFSASADGQGLNPETGAALAIYPSVPTSAGSIHITAADPTIRPTIVPHFLTTAHDQQALSQGVQQVRQALATDPLASLIEAELLPAEPLDTVAAVAAFAQGRGFTADHAIGSCSMGSVVDPQLRVLGAENLRVVDASVFPHHTSGGTLAPTLALAWLAAEVITG